MFHLAFPPFHATDQGQSSFFSVPTLSSHLTFYGLLKVGQNAYSGDAGPQLGDVPHSFLESECSTYIHSILFMPIASSLQYQNAMDDKKSDAHLFMLLRSFPLLFKLSLDV